MTQSILSISGLGVNFGALQAVKDVSFEAGKGKITAVIGPNGAGKSSLFNLISGAIAPTTGKVIFDTQEVTGWTPSQMLKAGLSRSFQITNLFFELSVHENLRLAAQYLEGGKGWLSPVKSHLKAESRVQELMDEFGLNQKQQALAGHLSHGEQRRLEIAVSLASRPRMLLLDEPTQGMSHADTIETEVLIRRLAAQHGLSILLVEHDVDLVMNISDHVVVMHQGQKLAEGRPEEIRANAQVQSAYFGEKREHK